MAKKISVKKLTGKLDTKKNMYLTKGKGKNAYVIAFNRKTKKTSKVPNSTFTREHNKLYFVSKGEIKSVPTKY